MAAAQLIAFCHALQSRRLEAWLLHCEAMAAALDKTCAQVHDGYSTGGDALITICLWQVQPVSAAQRMHVQNPSMASDRLLDALHDGRMPEQR